MAADYGWWRRPAIVLRLGTAALCLCSCLVTSGCTAGPAAARSATSTPAPASAGPPAAGATFPAADAAAIRETIDTLNAAAGGPVSAQRAALDALVLPRSAAAQTACPAATTTIRFEPVYQDLRTPDPAEADAAATNPADGTAYLLPTLITIFSGPRITGTDLTTLHLFVNGGQAHTSVLCVG